MRRGGQGVRTKDAERGDEVGDRPRDPGPVAGPPSPRMRRGGQGVRTKDAERGNEVGDRPPGSRASCWFPLSAYAERGTGGEDYWTVARNRSTASSHLGNGPPSTWSARLVSSTLYRGRRAGVG